MPPLQGAILRAGGKTFALSAECEISAGVRTGYVLDGTGNQWSSIFAQLLDSYPGVDIGLREGIHFDLGGGESMVEIEATSWQGSSLSWGGVSGAAPLTQMGVLQKTLRDTQIHSFEPAILEYGEFSAPGRYAPLSVVVESPRITYSAESPGTIDVSLVALETVSFDEDAFLDALALTG